MDSLKQQLVDTSPMMGSTPKVVLPVLRAKSGPSVDARQVSPNLSVKGNPQSDAQSRAMNSAYKNTKVFR